MYPIIGENKENDSESRDVSNVSLQHETGHCVYCPWLSQVLTDQTANNGDIVALLFKCLIPRTVIDGPLIVPHLQSEESNIIHSLADACIGLLWAPSDAESESWTMLLQ